MPQPRGNNFSEDPVLRGPAVSSARILVFRIGQLGDTIVALPAMWAVKHNFPAAYLALLYDQHPRKRYVFASDLLRGAGLFDEFLTYPVAAGDAFKPWRMTSLLLTLRRKRFDTLVYLAPSIRSPEQVARDRRFFSLAGIRTFLGMDGFVTLPSRINGQPMAESLAESDLLLDRLGASGLVFSPPDRARMDLGLGIAEDLEVNSWLQGLEPFGARSWVAVAPGSKMPAKRWPLECFSEVVQRLIEKFDVWPVVLGGVEDRPQGDTLLAQWRRGYNAAGRLSLRAAAAALKHCAFYLGNDTGTMHLAAAVGTKCVAIFSARDRPGRWNPSGDGHRVLRSQIDCEGCGLVECLERHNECLARISVHAVAAACEAFLGSEPGVSSLKIGETS
jgi:ADP-heptose:LPS heptosyltransferase